MDRFLSLRFVKRNYFLQLNTFFLRPSVQIQQAVFNVFTVVENLVDLKPELSNSIIKDTPLMKFLLDRQVP
jgi:hypothetical protein